MLLPTWNGNRSLNTVLLSGSNGGLTLLQLPGGEDGGSD
jgi:hypothetical protein